MKFLVGLLLPLLLPLQVFGAVAFVTSTSAVDTADADGIITATGVDTTSVTHPVIVVCMSYRQNAAQAISGITHAGNAMTQIGSTVTEGGGAIGCFYRVGSASGNVVGTLSAAATNIEIGVLVFSGAHQASPIGTPQTAKANGTDSTGTTTAAVTSAAGGMVVDGLMIRGGLPTGLTPGVSQTQRESETAAASIHLGMSTAPGATSVPMSWTWTSLFRWAHIAIPINSDGDLVLAYPYDATTAIPLRWVYPLDADNDGDSNDDSPQYWRHRRAPSGIPWRIPLALEGGAPLYNFDIQGNPPECLTVQKVGYDTGQPPYYAYLECLNPVPGTYSIQIRARDQANHSATLSWTLQVIDRENTTYFMFLDSAAGDDTTGTGAYSSPKQTVNAWYNGTLANFDNASKQIFYQGTFNLGGVADLTYSGSCTQQLRVDERKPRTHWAYGTGATWNGNGVYWQLDSGGGWSFGDITYRDPDVIEGQSSETAPDCTGVRVQHFLGNRVAWRGGGTFRMHLQTVQADGTTPGPVPSEGSNSSAIHFGLAGAGSAWAAFVGDTYELQHASALQIYDANDVTMQGATFRNSSNLLGIHNKGGTINRTWYVGLKAIENNDFGTTSSAGFLKVEWIADPLSRDDVYLLWSSILDTSGRCFWAQGDSEDGDPPLADSFLRQVVARSNIQCAHMELENVHTGDFTSFRNLVQHSGTYTEGIRVNGGNSPTVIPTSNDAQTSGVLDGTTNLRVGGPNDEQGAQFTP